MTIDIEKTSNGRLLNITNPSINLTYVDSTDKADYKMYLLKDIVQSTKKIQTNIGEFESEMVYERMINHMKTYIPDLNINWEN